MNDILKGIPDKRQDKNTTSLKFKQDMIEFLGDDYKDKTCLEIGSHRGYTTRVLSFLFKKVISCEINDELRKLTDDQIARLEELRRNSPVLRCLFVEFENSSDHLYSLQVGTPAGVYLKEMIEHHKGRSI